MAVASEPSSQVLFQEEGKTGSPCAGYKMADAPAAALVLLAHIKDFVTTPLLKLYDRH